MTTARLSPLDCTCFRVRGAARRVTQIYGRHLAPTGLKISQFSLLGFVSAEGPVSIGRLSELLATDRTTLTRNLQPLLSAGLIERATSGDKRRHELVATAAGRAMFKRALPLWAAAEQEVRAAMGTRLTAELHGAIVVDARGIGLADVLIGDAEVDEREMPVGRELERATQVFQCRSHFVLAHQRDAVVEMRARRGCFVEDVLPERRRRREDFVAEICQ